MYTNLTTNFKIPKYYYYYFYFYLLDKIFSATNLWINIAFSSQGRFANIVLPQMTLLTDCTIKNKRALYPYNWKIGENNI